MLRSRTPVAFTELPRRDDAQFLGRIRAAAMLDLNPQTIDKFIRTGQLRGFRIGRKVVVRKDELLALLEEIQ